MTASKLLPRSTLTSLLNEKKLSPLPRCLLKWEGRTTPVDLSWTRAWMFHMPGLLSATTMKPSDSRRGNRPIAISHADKRCLLVLMGDTVKRASQTSHHPQRGEVPSSFRWLLLTLVMRRCVTWFARLCRRPHQPGTSSAWKRICVDAPPLRMECFWYLLTLHGNFTVASMVVFTNEQKPVSRLKIRWAWWSQRDFVSMTEVL